MSDPAADSKTAFELTLGQRIVVWTVGTLIRLWGRSIRIEITDEDRRTLGRQDQPVALVAWHNRLFMGTEVYRRFRGGRPYWALISASKDGAWLVGLFRAVGIPSIRGSSSWGAREAATAVIQKLRDGEDIAITPDGPKGPCYEFKPGGLIVARRAQAPLVLIGMQYTRYRQLKSWDRFVIPLPFSRIRFRARSVDPDELPKNRDEALAKITAMMREINGPDI